MQTTPRSDVERVTRATRLSAAVRLVSGPEGGPPAVGAAFLRRAQANGVELGAFWAAFTDAKRARQSALVVPQSGRTGMIFLSGLGPPDLCGDPERQHADRVTLLGVVMDEAPRLLGQRLHLLQALPSPEETWAQEAYAAAGMMRLGDLLYLRRPLNRPGAGLEPVEWPDGVEVRAIRGLDEHLDGPALRTALERTYIDTLDCPGLCDMRDISDVIESHQATGRFDPALWWIVWHEGNPEGCVLLSPSPEQGSVELVYMGLGPALRGKRLARPLLEAAIARARRTGMREVNCAVDARNEPARAVYASIGFAPFAQRVAYVFSTRSASSPA